VVQVNVLLKVKTCAVFLSCICAAAGSKAQRSERSPLSKLFKLTRWQNLLLYKHERENGVSQLTTTNKRRHEHDGKPDDTY